MQIVVGNQYRYRVNKGRGRPAVGEVVGQAGPFLRMKNLRSGVTKNVSPKSITAEYEFKPYTKRA
jgi:hypothetical protein